MSSIQDLEAHIKSQEKAVETKRAAEKLFNNREFRKVISEGFMLEEAARSIAASTSPFVTERAQRESIEAARAAGYLEQYLQRILTLGSVAETNLEDAKDELAAMRYAAAQGYTVEE